VIGVAHLGHGVRQGRLAARARAGAGRRGGGPRVSVLRRRGPRRDGGAGELRLGGHAQDVVHAEGRGQLAALLLLDVHRDVVVVHVGRVV